MKIRWIILLLTSALLFSACQKQTNDLENFPALETSNGLPIQLSNYRGKWIIINYWASWCAPCLREIPELNHFHQAHRDRDAIVLGVNFDQLDETELKTVIKQMKIIYPHLKNDPAELLKLEQVSVLPSTYIFTPEGKFKQALYGEQTQQKLEKFLGLQEKNDG